MSAFQTAALVVSVVFVITSVLLVLTVRFSGKLRLLEMRKPSPTLGKIGRILLKSVEYIGNVDVDETKREVKKDLEKVTR